MLIDNLKIAYKNIKERKSRVFLTFLGIAIGIMAIISLMGLGEGMEQAVIGELSSLSDTIIVTTGEISASPMGGGFSAGANEHFTERDIDDISRINGIESIDPIHFGLAALEYNGETQYVRILGMDTERMADIFGIDFLGLESGEFINEGEQNKCVVGYNVAKELFDNDIYVGSKIQLNSYNFYVNGIYKKQGAGFSTETDDYIHMSVRDCIKITENENISGILIKAADIGRVDAIADEIEFAVGENHGDEDFANAVTMSSVVESIQEVLSIINVVLIGIAGISLIVASIGIMNTMLTSVMERTHEIGIMKAIGAKNYDVMSIFIMEGVLISLFGGIIGILLGVIGTQGFTNASGGMMGSGVSISPIITSTSILISIFVAVFVGVMSSLYPARKAAKMSPIEAVRYE
jgi:putative ABC transport system permease protein